MYIEFDGSKVKLVNNANIEVKTLRFANAEDVEDAFREAWQLVKDKYVDSRDQEERS